MTDAVIGSVAVAVVPSARDFWRRFEEQTKSDVVNAGRHLGADLRRTMQAEVDRGVTVKANADTTQARAQLASLTNSGKSESKGLLQALLPLAPAVVPLGAAAAAAAGEFVGLGAAGILALTGIKREMAGATPLGMQYAGLVSGLKGNLHQLQGVAERGVLNGFVDSQAKLTQEMPLLNRTIAQQSVLLGGITSHLVGGLAGGFRTFAPLLNQVGQSVDRVAAKFEGFATGPGGARFAHTLSSDYAKVAPVIDDIGRAIGKIIAASHGVGLPIVSELGLLARIVSGFPTPALEAIIGGFVAFRGFQAIQGIIGSASGALGKFGADSTVTAAQTRAAGLATEASMAQEAAAVAVAKANEREAFALTQAQIAESAAAQGSVLAAGAAETALAAQVEANAFRSAADQAQASAARIAAASAEAAAAARAAAATASGGLLATLGPAALVTGGLFLLTAAFSSNSAETAKATAEIQGYTAALVASHGVLDDTVRSKIATSLADQGLIDKGQKLGLTTKDLIDYTLGNAAAQDKVTAALNALKPAALGATDGHGNLTKKAREAYDVLGALSYGLGVEKKNFADAAKAAKEQADAIAAASGATAEQTRALNNGNTAIRDYVAAVDAFNKSEDTAADRAKLLGSVLKAANGDTLGYANTMVQAATANQQLVTDFKNLRSGIVDLTTGTIDYHNAGASPLLADLTALQTAAENAAAATYQHELKTRGATAAADDAFSVYQNDTRGALIDQARQLGITSDQAKRLADRYFGIKNAGDLKKRIEFIGQDHVLAALKGILADLDIISGKTVFFSVGANLTAEAKAAFAFASNPANANSQPTSRVFTQAAGGYISGPGTATSDSIPALLSNGEYVVNAAQTAKHHSLLSAINSGVRGFSTGGAAGDVGGVAPSSSSGGGGESGGFIAVNNSGKADKTGHVRPTKSTHTVHIIYTVEGHAYSSYLAASNAAVAKYKGDVALGIKIKTTDVAKFQAAIKNVQSTLSAAASATNDAFNSMLGDANKLGLSKGLAFHLQAENKILVKAVNDRDKTADALAAVRQKFADEKGRIKDAVTGAFDITSAGHGFDGNQPVTGANILAQQTQAANRVRKFVKDLEAAKGKGISKTYLQQLAEKGPDALPEVEAILSLSKPQIGQLNATSAAIYAQGSNLGGYVAGQMYGGSIASLTAREKNDAVFIDKLGKTIAAQVRVAIGPYADRPIIIKVNDREIARATASGVLKNARRS